MPDVMPDLWPSSLRTTVLSPLAILRTQAGLLKERTQGMLEGQVTTDYDRRTKETFVSHHFEVYAPGLKYSRELLAARHAEGAVYPVYLLCDYLSASDVPEYAHVIENNEFLDGFWEAKHQTAFLTLLGLALKHDYAVSLLDSLIARINDEATAVA